MAPAAGPPIAVMGGPDGKKYVSLRKRLDQLGYRQSLGIDSLPLVDKLFNDLVHTTESLKKSKQQTTRVVHETRDVDAAIEPYALENARLLKEHNELHQKLLQKNDQIDVSMREYKDQLRKLEHESADIKFLNTQYLAKIRGLEKEVKARDDKIKEIQDKNSNNAVVQTPGGKKKNVPFRRQRMDIDSLIPEPDQEITPVTSPRIAVRAPEDPYVADLLNVADERIGALQKEVDSLNLQLDTSDKKISNLKHQVEARDEEIDRLSRLLETGRPHESLAAEARAHSNDRVIDHLNLQVDYLQRSNRELEERLRRAIERKQEASVEARTASTDRAHLLDELSQVDHENQKLARDRENALDIADKEVSDAKQEIYKSQNSLKFTQQEKEDLENECNKLRNQIERQNKKYKDVNSDLENNKEMLERAEKIRKQQQQKIEELSKSERELLMELEKLRLKKGGKPGQGSGAVSPTRLNQMMKSVEAERDYYKKELEKSKRSKSPSRKAAAKEADSKQSEQLESVIRALEDEKEYYKREYERARKAAARDSSASPTRLSRSPVRERLTTDAEIKRLTRERNELQAMLDKFERHMSEIQSNVKILTGERDKLQNLYHQANEEVQRLRRELMKSPKSAKASAAAQQILQRVENERDEAVNDLRRISTERDALREKLSNEQQLNASEKSRLKGEIEELTAILRPTEAERDDLIRRVASLREMVANLEDEVKLQSSKIRSVDDEAHEFKGEANQLRMLVEQTEKSLADTKYRLEKKAQELGQSEDTRAQLDVELHAARNHVKKEKEEVSRLRSIIKSLDHEKDVLQGDLDNKTERIASLNSELDNKTHQLNNAHSELSDLEQQVLSLSETVNGRDREIKSLSRQLETKSYDSNELARTNDALNAEIRRLQDDLGEMTRECQSLAQQLTRTEQERDELKSKVFALHKETQRQEDVIASQEQEKNHLLNTYRQVQTESSRHENDAHTYQTELSAARLEIVSKEGEIRRLEERARDMERDIQEYQESGMQYEAQLSHQSSTISKLEQSQKMLQQDKDAILADLAAVRELCVKLDSSKDSLSRKIAQKNIECDQLSNQLEDARQEAEMLKKQVESETHTIRNLEDLLTQNREKEFASQLSSQERETEIQLYKERLGLSEAKSASLQREIQQLKTRLGTSDAELERCRRQLTNERFERERSEQDLRRIKQGRYPSPSRYANNGSGDRPNTTNPLTRLSDTAPPDFHNYSPKSGVEED